ncbi:MAG: hypothetical protein AAFW76_04305, partial [Pseudomonadota bacterium]
IPGDQSFEDARNMFAITIEENSKLSVDQHKDRVIQENKDDCGVDSSLSSTYFDSPEYTIFFVICGNYLSNPQKGEVAVYYAGTAQGDIFKISHHFAGPSFDPRDKTQWPGTVEQLSQFVANLQTVRGSSR